MAARKNKGASPAPDTQTGGDATSLESATPQTETAEMVLTYDKSTGQVVRIEKLDAGARQELSEEEYGAFFGHAEAHEGYDPHAEAFAVAHQQAGFEQGYYHGLIEYETALTGETASGYTPEEEAAYHQGVADYHNMVTGE